MEMNECLMDKKQLIRLVILTLFLSIPQSLFAQSPGSITVGGITAKLFYAGVREESGQNEYRWKMSYDRALNDPLNPSCVQKSVDGTGWFDYYDGVPFYNSFGQVILNPFTEYSTLRAEAWESDTAPECEFNGSDDIHCGPNSMTFRYIDYPPEVVNTIQFDICTNNPFSIQYEFTYKIPQPGNETSQEDEAICDAYARTLKHKAYLGSFYNNPTYRFQAIWEYQVGSTTSSWTTLATENIGNVFTNFTASHTVDLRNLSGVSANNNTEIRIRSKTIMRVLTGPQAGSSFQSSPTSVTTYNVSPLPPTVSNVTTTPSCPGDATGTISFDVAGLGTYKGALFTGHIAGPCNPADPGANCLAPVILISGNSHTISNIAKGQYTLLVSNQGGTAGVCSNYVYLNVGEIATLTHSTPIIVPASCFGATDGEVTLAALDGRAPYSYKLKQGSLELSSSDGKFTGLSAGVYSGEITDDCGQLATKVITVGEPIQLVASITSTSPSCSDPDNGLITVTTTQGGGHYTYQLEKEGIMIDELADTMDVMWSSSGLSTGEYILRIIDTDYPLCMPLTQSITLTAPAALTFPSENVSVSHVSCYGLADGIITLINGEGSGDLKYELKNLLTSAILSPSVDLKFVDLTPGNYQLTKKRNITGCLDQVEYPNLIEITEPEQLSIALTKNNIRCHDATDGSISATIIGATPTDRLKWEINIDGSWTTLSQTTATITSLAGGFYRLSVVNANGCSVESDEVEIIDPAEFVITDVAIRDITCAGGLGNVTTTVEGGVIPYTYTYTSSIGDVITVTDETVDLATGVYTLTIRDAGGCDITYQQQVVISSPQVPLSFTFQASNFGGFNVPCYGGSGFIDVLPTGGNGGAYKSYSFSIDGILYQSEARINNLTAGNYTIHVKDERGCEVTQSTTLTEPLIGIGSELISKTDVKCYGETTGSITVKPIGGSAPYTYTLNNILSQNEPLFTALPPGDFTISIRDQFGCATSLNTSIALLNSPMYLTLHKNDVSCFDGSDGLVEAIIAGVTGPFEYAWQDVNTNIAKRENVKAGEYMVEVRDQQGCTQQKSISINQPEIIKVESIAIPVCIGKVAGKILVQTAGGVSPFSYSLNNDLNYQSSSLFENVSAGEYIIYAKDANECVASVAGEVVVKNTRPEPDFIVASKENAKDTLVIKEISIPKPDSIQWIYDPKIVVLNQDQWSPEIKVEEEGQYPVTLKGYFDGCVYSKTLTLFLGTYDPDKKNSIAQGYRTIKEMSSSPNPNAGEFDFSIKLNGKQRVSLVVLDVFGVSHYKDYWESVAEVDTHIQLPSDSPSGIYLIQVVTNTELRQERIVITR
jgi:hypothetical protein